MITISVSDLHLCQHCPRLFGYKRKGAKNAWRIGLIGSGTLPSNHMHNIAKTFFKDVSGLNDLTKRADFIKTISCSSDTLEENILEFLRARYFIPF